MKTVATFKYRYDRKGKLPHERVPAEWEESARHKRWRLFNIFGLAFLQAEPETWEHHVEWLEARYETPELSFNWQHRLFGGKCPSAEFIARWAYFIQKWGRLLELPIGVIYLFEELLIYEIIYPWEYGPYALPSDAAPPTAAPPASVRDGPSPLAGAGT
jgi:hypothetical protein